MGGAIERARAMVKRNQEKKDGEERERKRKREIDR